MRTCRHFEYPRRGKFRDGRCHAGVRYGDVMSAHAPDSGIALCLPCQERGPEEREAKHEHLYAHALPCAKKDVPTPEEARIRDAEFREWIREVFPLIEKAKHLIIEKSDAQNSIMQINCPRCGCELRASYTASNGHTRGKCSTEGCLEWIE